MDCGICLDQLKSPVSLPCGHVHCEKCLVSHVNASPDALKAACPTCRSTFYVVSQNLALVPPKYHDFFLPSVRKLYIDIPSQKHLKKELSTLKARVTSLEKDNDRLMGKCEGYMDAANVHAEGESQAIIEADDAARKIKNLEKKYAALEEKYRTLRLSSQGGSNGQNTSLISASTSTNTQASQPVGAPRRAIQCRFNTIPYLPPPTPEHLSHPTDPAYISISSRPKRPLPKPRVYSSPSSSRFEVVIDPPPTFKKRRCIKSTQASTSTIQAGSP